MVARGRFCHYILINVSSLLDAFWQSRKSAAFCVRSINLFERGRWWSRQMRADGIESFFACSLLILHDLQESEKKRKSQIKAMRFGIALVTAFALVTNSDRITECHTSVIRTAMNGGKR